MKKMLFCPGLILWGILFGLILSVLPYPVEAKMKHPLVGVWTLQQQKDGKTIICYKILKRNGEYVNLKSADQEGKCLYVSRKGKYVPKKDTYTEYLMEYNGKKTGVPVEFPLEYKFLSKNVLEISYQLGNQKCTETWSRIKKAPKY